MTKYTVQVAWFEVIVEIIDNGLRTGYNYDDYKGKIGIIFLGGL
jgi:hypothetical protein